MESKIWRKKMKEIECDDYEFVNIHSDAGSSGVQFNCPACSDTITIAEYDWWSKVCSCGYEWELEIIIKGYKDD